MKRRLLTNLIITSTFVLGATCFEATFAYADSYNNQIYYNYGTNGEWKNYNGLWYFYDSNKVMKTGWILNKGKWYFLDGNGVMQTGVIQINGTIYLFNENGEMQVGNAVIDGVMYDFDSSGALSGSSYPNVAKGFSVFGDSMISYLPDQIITNEDSTPDNPSEGNEEDKSVEYTIEFRNEDGDTIKSKNVYKGEEVVLYEPSKDGYEFDCWSTKEDGEGKTYDALEEITVKGDMVLYANWDEEDDDSDSNVTVYAKAISITSDDNKNTITEKNGTLQLQAVVEPENVSNTNVTWTVTSGSENATISKSGLVTAVSDGDVTVCAETKDGTEITEKFNITITGQTSESTDTDDEDESNTGEVSKTVSSIEIVNQPNLDYDYNEEIDLSELKVKIYYDDGTVSDEISYSQFSDYNIIVKNYSNGQTLEQSYVNKNPNIIIYCSGKTVNTDNLNMNVVESPKLLSNKSTFDKYDPQDVVFEYSDGTNVDAVKNVTIKNGDSELTEDDYSVDYESNEITIKEEYFEEYDVGYVNLDIILEDEEENTLVDRLCIITVTDSEVKAAPNNFIKLEAGSKNQYTKITILDTTAEDSTSDAANYDATDLQYAVNSEDLATSNLLVTWKDYTGPVEVSVNDNDYINIRKKPAVSSQTVLVASKQITEDCIADISSMNTIKSFKLKDSDGNVYEGTINGLNITVIANNPESTIKDVDLTKLTPIVEYTGTAEESSKVTLNIGSKDIVKESEDDTSSTITYSTASSYSSSISLPVTCKVIAESGATRIYNISVYNVKPQAVQIRPNKTVSEYVTESVIKEDEDGEPIRDEDGSIIYEDQKVLETKTINYSKLYSDAGIDINNTKNGLTEISIWNPLDESHYDAMDDIVTYTDLGESNSSQNANVGIMFTGAPSSAQSVKISTSLDSIDLSEDIIKLNTDTINAVNKNYLKYIEVAARRSKQTGGSIWQYIYADDISSGEGNKSQVYYYEWLDSNGDIVGYSKLEIMLEVNE